jgi:hypothetical protein
MPWHVRYTSESDRIDASQRNAALCQKATHAAEQKSRSFDTLSAGPSNVVAERPSRCQVDDACNFNDRLSQLGTKESDVYREAGQQPLEQAHDRKNFAFRRAAPSG